MPSSSEQRKLEIDLIATDKGSKVLDGFAQAVDKVDGKTADVELTATDKATADVEALMTRLAGLTDDEKRVVLTAEARKLESEVKRALVLVGKVDGEKAEAIIEAKDLASTKLASVQGELDEIDRRTADATLEATDNASGEIATVDGKLDTLDTRTVDATIDANRGPGLTGILSDIDGLPGAVSGLGGTLSKLASPGGAIALVAGGFGAALTTATNVAIQADQIADFTGASVEEASRLAAVLKDNTQIEMGDLLDIVAQMQGVISQSPELLRQLGVKAEDAKNPLDLLVKVVDALNAGQLSANDKILIGAQLFGEEGVRQINELTAGIEGTLAEAIEGISDSRVISDEDVEASRKLKAQWTEIQAAVQGFVVTLGQGAIPVIDRIGDSIGLWGDIFGKVGDAIDAWNPFNDDDSFWGQIENFEMPSGWTDALANEFVNLGGDIDRLVAGHMRLADVQIAVKLGLPTDEFTLTAEATEFLAAATGEASEATAEWAKGAGVIPKRMEDATSAIKGATEATSELTKGTGEIPKRMADAADATNDAKESTEDFGKAARDAGEAVQDQIDVLNDQVDAIEGVIEAQRSSTDSYYAERQAVRDAEDALANYREVADDNEATASDLAEAQDDLVMAYQDVADAAVETARQEAAARGATISHTQAVDIQNAALLNQARTLEGPEQQALLAHTMRINGIPESRITQILTDTDPNDLAQTEGEINNTSRTRKSAVQADAVQSWVNDAETKLNWLARARDAAIIARAKGTNGKGLATGTPMADGGSVTVGEQGPEIVDLPQGASVTPAHRTGERERRSAGSGSSVVNNTFNFPAGVNPAAVYAAQRRYERRNGTG